MVEEAVQGAENGQEAKPVEKAAETREFVKEDDQHLLEHEWALWFDNQSGKNNQDSWGESLIQVYSFKTVENFWALMNNIVSPSKLNSGSDIFLFKSHIRPTWEDKANSDGGGWTANLKQQDKTIMDTWWMNALMAVIGEYFDEGEEVNGVSVHIRRVDRITLWTRTANNEAVQTSVGRQFKQLLNIPDTIGFICWQDKASKVTQEKYTV